MFDKIKKKIAVSLIKRKYINKGSEPVVFNDFFKKAINYLVIMPENDEDFKNSFAVIKELAEKGKSITLFIPEHRYSLIPAKEKYRVLSYSIQHVSKLFIPDVILQEKLRKKSFDVILNLNIRDNLFLDSSAFILNSSYRVGFKKGDFSNFYTLQIPLNENNSNISYENLLNSLKMF